MAKVGRTPQYTEWLTDEKLSIIADWVRNGLTNEQICENMQIAVKTFYEWKARFPQLSEVLKRNKQYCDANVENALYKRALGYDVVEERTETDVDGVVLRTIKTRRHIPADTTAQIYWLNNRRANVWRNRTEITAEIDSTEQLDKVVEAIKGVRNGL